MPFKVLILGNSIKSVISFKKDFIATLIEKGHTVFVSSPENDIDIEAQLIQMGAHYHVIKMNRTGINPFADLKYYFQLRKYIRKIQPDIVYSYTHKPVIWGSIAAKKERVPKISSMISGLGYAFTGKPSIKKKFVHLILKHLLKFGFKQNNLVYYLNEDDRSVLERQAILPKTAHLLQLNGCGVNTDYYKPSKSNSGGNCLPYGSSSSP